MEDIAQWLSSDVTWSDLIIVMAFFLAGGWFLKCIQFWRAMRWRHYLARHAMTEERIRELLRKQ